MDVDFIFKVAAIGIIVAVLNQLLQRSGREEQAMLTTLAGLIVVMLMIVGKIGTLFDTIKSTFWTIKMTVYSVILAALAAAVLIVTVKTI